MTAEIEVWDITTGEVAWSIRGHLGSIAGLAFSPDGKVLTPASINFSSSSLGDRFP
jgi:WD40 repeat protein